MGYVVRTQRILYKRNKKNNVNMYFYNKNKSLKIAIRFMNIFSSFVVNYTILYRRFESS